MRSAFPERTTPVRLVLVLVLAAAGIGLRVAPAAASGTVHPHAVVQPFTDLGDPDVVGYPAALNDAHEVLTDMGVLHANGVLEQPDAVPGAKPGQGAMVMSDLSPDGLVVGSARTTNTLPEDHAVYWDTRATTTPAFYPAFSDLDSTYVGCPGHEDALTTVDSTDEAAGNAGEYTAACSGISLGITVASTSSTETQVPTLETIRAITPAWALGTVSGVLKLLNRGTNAVTDAGITGSGPRALAPDGAVVGSDGGGHTVVVAAGGATTQLTAPGGATIGAASINPSHEIVATTFPASGHSRAVLWSTPGAAPTDLSAGPSVPSGWTLETANAISPDGDIVGVARDGGLGLHVYLLLGNGGDLTASIEVTDGQGHPYAGGPNSTGKTLVATVTLSVPASAAHAVSSLAVDPTGVTATPTTALSAPGPPTPAPPTTLNPGQSASYSVTYTVAHDDKTTFSVTATGDESGTPQQASASTTVRLGQPFTVDVTFLQNGTDLVTSPLGANTIKLADTDAGEIPQPVTVRVRLTNGSADAQNNVTLSPLTLAVLDPASAHNPFEMTVTASPAFALGSIGVGGSATRDFTTNVTGNQEFHVSELVTSADATSSATEISTGTNDLHALPTALLLVDAHPAAGTPSPVKTGQQISVDARVRNLSNTRTLDLDPLIPDFTGNGGGSATVDGGVATADGFVAPVTGDVKPGDTVPFHLLVQTVVDGGTRTTITLDPAGARKNPNGTETPLVPADIRVTSDTSPLLLHLDDSAPAPRAAGGGFRATYLFSQAALESFRDWAASTFHAITDIRGFVTSIGAGLVATGGLVVKNAQALGVVASFIKAELALNAYWGTLTPAQHQQFADEVALDAQAADDAWGQLHGAIDSAVFGYFADFDTALSTGNTAQAATILGGKVGSGLPNVLATFMPNLIMGKVARGLGWAAKSTAAVTSTSVGQVISLAEKIKSSKLVLKAAKAIKGVEVGDNLLLKGAKVLKDDFGMAQRDINIFAGWAKRRGLIIAVRQRNPITTKLLKTGRYLLKPEAIKIKNVDELDQAFLGYLKSDFGSVVLKEPDPIGLVTKRLAGQPHDVRVAALKRYGMRFKEWKKHEQEYKGWSLKNSVDIGFNQSAQGAGLPKLHDLRQFKLDAVRGPGAKLGEYYRVQLGSAPNHGGVLKLITGDLDVVAITLADGRVPSAAVRGQLYADLSEALGMQHGETLSWILSGEVLSKTKAGLLADHLPGRELLAAFGPDGICRAAYFDPHLTTFNQVTGETIATFVGAFVTPVQAPSSYASLLLNALAKVKASPTGT